VHFLSLDQMRDAISELGYTPRQRNVFYQLASEEHERKAVEANRLHKPVQLHQLAATMLDKTLVP
jgi:cyclic dehypoxanthinyl futalosine synthase